MGMNGTSDVPEDQMLRCAKCGTANPPDVAECLHCGEELRETRRRSDEKRRVLLLPSLRAAVALAVALCTAASVGQALLQGPFAYASMLLLEYTAMGLSLLLLMLIVVLGNGMAEGTRWSSVRAWLLLLSISLPWVALAAKAHVRAMPIGFRRAITAKVNLPELQSAAMSMVAKQESVGEEIRMMYKPSSPDVPEAIARLHPRYLDVVLAEQDRPGFVRLRWGAAFVPSFGIEVGPLGFRSSVGGTRRWYDGVYGWVSDA